MLREYINNLAINKEIYFKVKVLPGTGKTEFLAKMSDGTIKIALRAVPEKGKANQELIRFLASELEVHKYQVKIVSGLAERTKLIKIIR